MRDRIAASAGNGPAKGRGRLRLSPRASRPLGQAGRCAAAPGRLDADEVDLDEFEQRTHERPAQLDV
jgi:hypothetical protein